MKNLFAFLAIIILAAACKKQLKDHDDNNNPTPVDILTPTQSGANNVVFKVDDETHIYQGIHNASNYDGIAFQKNVLGADRYVSIWADESKYQDHLEIRVGTWNIELNKQYKFLVEGSEANYVVGETDKYFANGTEGYILFTRYDDSIVSGVFSFPAYNTNNDKKNISNGYFDIKYN